MPLAKLSAGFQSVPLLFTSELGHSGADSWVGRFVYILGPCGSLQWTLLWGWEFLLLPQPPQMFSVRGFGGLFPHTGTLVCAVCLTPQLFLLVCHTHMWDHVLPQPLLPCLVHHSLLCLPHSSSLYLAASPLHLAACLRPSYWSGWMFLLYLLGCQTPIKFGFLSVVVVFCF